MEDYMKSDYLETKNNFTILELIWNINVLCMQ